jgi:hypothetical protein
VLAFTPRRRAASVVVSRRSMPGSYIDLINVYRPRW